ncbi:hypothetical protein TWF281_009856 [Arthrobotrys megalospora]
MKFLSLLLVAVSTITMVNASPQASANPSCYRDNCLRGILGRPTSIASADCTTFLQTTVMEFTATTSAIFTPPPAVVKKRDLTTGTPSTWPAYAACSSTVGGQVNGQRTQIAGLQRYSSACSCIGVQVTSTASVQAVQTISVPEFNIGLTCLNRDSYYLYVDNGMLRAHDFNSMDPPPTLFSLDSSNNLLYNGVRIETRNTDDPSELYAGVAGSPVTCSFQPGGPYFNTAQNCVSGGSKQYFSIPGEGPGNFALFFGTAVSNCFITGAVFN